ncbi:MAG: Lrp/AsnC family transcriptional regulator [Candidatus Woesearchaeota archaeon]
MKFKKLKKKELLLLSHLRENGRISLTDLSKKTGIPVSTSYEKIKRYKERIGLKPTIDLNFKKIGFNLRTFYLLNVKEGSEEELKKFLKRSGNLNSLMRINNQYDYFVECFFKDLIESEDFEKELKPFCRNIKHHYAIKKIEENRFLSRSNLLNLGVL